jgi:tetratricopeptide (TPR) repeat protein
MKCLQNKLFFLCMFFFLIVGYSMPVFGAEGTTLNPKERILKKQQGDKFAREGNYVKAAEAYGKVLSVSSTFSDSDRLQMAKVLAWAGNLDRSKNELNALLTKDPKNLKARIQLARILFWQAEIDDSTIETDKALQQSPKDRDALILKADIARFRKEYDKAISFYQELLKTEKNFDARIGLAYAYLGTGKLVEAHRNFNLLAPAFPYQRKEVALLKSAIAEAEKPKDITPDDLARQAMEKGNLLANVGKNQEAAVEYLKTLSLSSIFTVEERLQVASVLLWAGNFTEGRQLLMKIIAEKPSFMPARIQLVRALLWSGEFDAALKEVDQVLRIDPVNRDALILKADIARSMREYDKAISIYQELLKAEDNFDARSGLTYAYLDVGNLEAARRNFDLLAPKLPEQNKEVELLKGAIAEAEKPKVLTQEDLGRQAMEKGDLLADEGKNEEAAVEYLKALSLSNSFTIEEQLHMASVLLWAGKLDEARKKHIKILDDHPMFVSARIQLARILMDSGELDAALKEVNQVLRVDPENRDALLQLASVQRMKGNFRPAIALTNELLKKQDDYVTREELTNAYLLSNYRVATDRNLLLLKPVFPYEETSLSELKERRDIAFNPSLSPGFTYFHSNDDNDIWRYFLNGTAWLGNWKTSVDYIHTEAKDLNGSIASDGVTLSTYSRMPFYGGIGGSIGLADSGRDMAWSLRGDVDIPDGSIGVAVGVDALSDTTAVSRNHIKVLSAASSLDYRLTDRISLSANYNYRDYSDNNNANDVIGSASFLVLRRPAAIAIGYRGRYLHFKRNTGDGYFDPQYFVSNALFANLSFEYGPLYGYVEPYGGYQSFTFNEEGNYSWFGGGGGMLGYRFSKHVAVEASAEGGNYALGASNQTLDAGGQWTYYQIGARLIITW